MKDLLRNKLFVRILFVLCAIYFIARGPLRAVYDSGDFLINFSAARCWFSGMNPYAPADLIEKTKEAGLQDRLGVIAESPSVYLPSAFPIFSLFAALPWTVAKITWLACLLAFSILTIIALARRWKERGLFIASLLLAFAPLHTGISKGQPAVLVCAMIILSWLTPQAYLGGLLLGVAMCIKPHVAIGFFLLALWGRQYKKTVTAGTVWFFITGIGLAFLAPGSIDTLRSNLNGSGYLSTNPASIISIREVIPGVVTYLAMALITLGAVMRGADRKISVAVVAAATMLIGYHRFYDAEILWLCVPLMVALKPEYLKSSLWVLYAVFLIPGQTIASQRLSVWTSNPFGWIALHHETLVIIVVWAMLVYATATKRVVSRV